MLERKVVSDGAGGWSQQWQRGISFEAAMATDISIEARIAEAQGTISRFTIAIPVALPLIHDNYIQRQKDGAYYRVTADPGDTETHPNFPIAEKQVTIEKVAVLPK